MSRRKVDRSRCLSIGLFDPFAASLLALAVAGGWVIQVSKRSASRAEADATAARAEAAAATARAERLATVGTLVGSLSHEINNTLMFMQGELEAARSEAAQHIDDPRLSADTRAGLRAILIRISARAAPPHVLVVVEDSAPARAPAAPREGTISLAVAGGFAEGAGGALSLERVDPQGTRRMLRIMAAPSATSPAIAGAEAGIPKAASTARPLDPHGRGSRALGGGPERPGDRPSRG